MKVGDWYRKLSPGQAAEAVEMYQRGLSCGAIAEFFGVSRNGMYDLLKRRTKMRSQKQVGERNTFHRGGETRDGRAQDLAEKAVERGVLVRPDACENC